MMDSRSIQTIQSGRTAGMTDVRAVKRTRGDPMRFPGANYTGDDAGKINPGNPKGVIGNGAQWTSDGVNSSMDVKAIVLMDTEHPLWIKNMPLNSIIFGMLVDPEKADQAKYRLSRFYRPMDAVYARTPHQINYILHRDTLRYGPRSLKSWFKDIRIMGALQSAPIGDAAGFRDRSDANSTSETRVIVYRPVHIGLLSNNWGLTTSGSTNPHLYYVLEETPITSEGIYYYPDAYNSSEVIHLGNRRNQVTSDVYKYTNRRKNKVEEEEEKKEEDEEEDVISYIPRLRAVACNSSHCPDKSDLIYEKTIEVNGKKKLIKDKRGYFYKVGRVWANDQSMSSLVSDTSKVSLLQDAKTSLQLQKLTVLTKVCSLGN